VISEAEARDEPNIIAGNFSIYSHPAYILFDSGATYSFISSKFVAKYQVEPTQKHRIGVMLPSGNTVICENLFENCPIEIMGENFPSDLYQFDLAEFDAILGMDWLHRHRAQIDCRLQKVSLRGPGRKRVSYKGLEVDPVLGLCQL